MLPFDAEGGGTEMGALLAYLFPGDAQLLHFSYFCPSFADSILVHSPLHRQSLVSFLPTSSPPRTELLYRASRDGWSPITFHDRCDDCGSTVVILRSEGGHVFGGYTPHSWVADDGEANEHDGEADEATFIFSLTNPSNHLPVKMVWRVGARGFPIYPDVLWGPAFGLVDEAGAVIVGGVNIRSMRDADTSLEGDLYPFQLPSDVPEDQVQTFLAGASTFLLSDMEVYSVYGLEGGPG